MLGKFDKLDKIDLHMHSTYSDGKYDPEVLVKRYYDNGFEKIAITDHDGIGGLKAAIECGKELGIEVIPGIEFSTSYDGHECHLLGYGFDIDNKPLNDELKKIWQYRIDRNKKLLAKLKEQGYDLDIDELLSQSKGGYVGKPNMARLMVKKDYITRPMEAFEPGKYLEAPDIKAIKRERILTEDAIKLIIQAGGKPVLAHPIKLKWFGPTTEERYWVELETMLKRLVPLGLYGLECYYPEHNEIDTKKYLALAEKYKLGVTKGSDFHGEDLK